MRIAVRYAVAAAVCAAFALVYAQFSHGVSSPFMTWAFIIPLTAGCGAALALQGIAARQGWNPHSLFPRAARASWACAVATFTVASLLHGIFDIAGTSSELLDIYVLAGVILAVIAIALWFASKPERS